MGHHGARGYIGEGDIVAALNQDPLDELSLYISVLGSSYISHRVIPAAVHVSAAEATRTNIAVTKWQRGGLVFMSEQTIRINRRAVEGNDATVAKDAQHCEQQQG